MISLQTKKHPGATFFYRPVYWLVGLIAVSFLGGCGILRPHDDPTRFYVLTDPHAVTERFTAGELKRLRIGLKPVEVPAYLRSKSIVVRTGPNEIHFAEFYRWAEPLDQGIRRVLQATLSSARNVACVALDVPGADPLDCEVALRILACEGVRLENGTSGIRFVATWEVRAVGTRAIATKRGGFTAGAVAWGGKDYGQLAQRLSEAIAGASLALAADLPREAGIPPNGTSEIVKP